MLAPDKLALRRYRLQIEEKLLSLLRLCDGRCFMISRFASSAKANPLRFKA